jgi:hypothetical protein
MRSLLQRARGTVVTAAVWAVTWAIVGPILGLLVPGETRWALPTLGEVLRTALSCSVTGAIGGTVFAIFVALDKRRQIDDFSMPHIAARGTIAGALVPVTAIAFRSMLHGHGLVWALPLLAQYATMGALCAAGTFAIAKRATYRLESPPGDIAPAT